MDKQIERIRKMEEALDASKAAIEKLYEALSEYEAVQDRFDALLDYYSNGQWRADFEADEEDLLPDGLKRGVLSEDAVYDLITEHRELMGRLKAVLK
jgi:hypothetical protein